MMGERNRTAQTSLVLHERAVLLVGLRAVSECRHQVHLEYCLCFRCAVWAPIVFVSGNLSGGVGLSCGLQFFKRKIEDCLCSAPIPDKSVAKYIRLMDTILHYSTVAVRVYSLLILGSDDFLHQPFYRQALHKKGSCPKHLGGGSSHQRGLKSFKLCYFRFTPHN